MKAKEFLKNKGINPIEPIYWDLEHKQIQLDELMDEFAEQQLKILNIPVVNGSLLAENYEKLQKNYELIKRQYELRGKIMDKWIKKYNLPIATACLDEEQ